jgi:dienelactone hydrolase
MNARSAEAVALEVFDLVRTGQFQQVHDRLAPPLRSLMPAGAIESAWSAAAGEHGKLVSAGDPVSEPFAPGAAEVKIPLAFEQGDLTLIITVTDAGWLAGIQLAPASAAAPTAPWEPPPYADPGRLREQDVTVGAGPLAVPGTLTLPREGVTHPAIVLLSGSGPHDRDETTGRNKPFKDLAWGLAAAGVAVLRFDKVTFAHGGQIAANPGFTLADEYVTDAVAAVGLLRRQPGIDPRQVYVLGHSLGGTVAPRVAAAEPAVAGLVILAGGTQPLHWAAVRQVRYLASLNPAAAAASQPAIDALTRQAEAVDSPELTAASQASDLPFGVPARYWLDLRGYDPVATAAATGKPMLILQGGRDYQVTVPDDLVHWSAGLAGRAGVTIEVFDADNHLFFTGTGPSSPAEYEPAQHMDAAVVARIAAWIRAAAT